MFSNYAPDDNDMLQKERESHFELEAENTFSICKTRTREV